MPTDAFTPYAQELCDIALRLCEAAAGKKKANADAIEAQIKAGLVHLARLNREHASLCVRANEAANGVVQQKLKHEEDAFLLQNKKCALAWPFLALVRRAKQRVLNRVA